MKNMLGLLLEDMTVKWNRARDVAQGLRTYITQVDTQLKALEANLNLRHYLVFPNTGNVDDNGGRNQYDKGGTSSVAAVNSLGPLHEQRGMERSSMPIK